MGKERISAQQMGLMIYTTVVFSAILDIPSITGQVAGKDLWLSPLWASFVGLVMLQVMFWLDRRFPGETIVQYSGQVVGTILGKALSAVLLFYFLHVNSLILRGYGEFLVGVFLEHTPAVFIMGVMTALVGYAVRSGVEVIGRLAQLFIPFTLLIWAGLLFLTASDWDVRHVQPVFENGIGPSVRGALVPAGWFADFILLSFLLPFVSNRKDGKRWGMLAWFSILMTMAATNLVALFLFGEMVATFNYPFIEVVRYIDIGEFFQHIDALLLAVWVVGSFVQITVFHFGVVLGTAQWFGLDEYRFLALPVGVLLVLFAEWVAPTLQELNQFLGSTAVVWNGFILMIPLGIGLLAWIGNRGERGKGVNGFYDG
ncbi:GerAB/ArcD/ProY family transporter [Desmospora profundinema]|uniref:Spore germination protein KB n=1 Tax=Desmospora profundinema TaxID=1571184 RepID=A0ABU1IJW1_9BACL|nr:endospore germination permease [Desmospora profundinema]MDR6224976.1 spore germination protein KB [Desmospora profundinema]